MRDRILEPSGTATTQAALGRALLDLTRAAPEAARRVVTVSPDVSSTTNLGGWVNKVGVWSVTERRDWFADDAETVLRWREDPGGRHVELGIAETNLVGLLGELGATWSRWGQPLLPIGVVYDPFVGRALEPWAFGVYAGGQSILVGTPSGVSLAPEGGAHQSVTTPSIGIEQPGVTAYEPAFALDVEWTLLARAQRTRRGLEDGPSWILDQAFPADRAVPLVTVLDGHPHALSFLATVQNVPHAALGVTRFGQSGALADVYRQHGIDAEAIVGAAFDLVDESPGAANQQG